MIPINQLDLQTLGPGGAGPGFGSFRPKSPMETWEQYIAAKSAHDQAVATGDVVRERSRSDDSRYTYGSTPPNSIQKGGYHEPPPQPPVKVVRLKPQGFSPSPYQPSFDPPKATGEAPAVIYRAMPVPSAMVGPNGSAYQPPPVNRPTVAPLDAVNGFLSSGAMMMLIAVAGGWLVGRMWGK